MVREQVKEATRTHCGSIRACDAKGKINPDEKHEAVNVDVGRKRGCMDSAAGDVFACNWSNELWSAACRLQLSKFVWIHVKTPNILHISTKAYIL
jgi:hypothetical protein